MSILHVGTYSKEVITGLFSAAPCIRIWLKMFHALYMQQENSYKYSSGCAKVQQTVKCGQLVILECNRQRKLHSFFCHSDHRQKILLHAIFCFLLL